jgi:hypothetical protein
LSFDLAIDKHLLALTVPWTEAPDCVGAEPLAAVASVVLSVSAAFAE